MHPTPRGRARGALSVGSVLLLAVTARSDPSDAPHHSTPGTAGGERSSAGIDQTTSIDAITAMAAPTPSALAQIECERIAAPSVLVTAPTTVFSVHGYAARGLWFNRMVEGRAHSHCVVLAWPAGTTNALGQPSRVAQRLSPSWLTAIANTLRRVPLAHARLLRRVVIDNRPTEHGIAPFDRADPQDERDGHTIWLNEHLFEQTNHWAHGNYGNYWSYHVNVDGVALASSPDKHDYFSPVLLHELGHLVMYHRVNEPLAAEETPSCARTCVDTHSCEELSLTQREAGCATAYCRPFRFVSSTENWAEQYRFYYQSAVTRALLGQEGLACLEQLRRDDQQFGRQFAAPWEQGLPDIARLRPTRWTSCQGRACKKF